MSRPLNSRNTVNAKSVAATNLVQNNSVAVFDGVDGTKIKGTPVTIDSFGNITTPGALNTGSVNTGDQGLQVAFLRTPLITEAVSGSGLNIGSNFKINYTNLSTRLISSAFEGLSIESGFGANPIIIKGNPITFEGNLEISSLIVPGDTFTISKKTIISGDLECENIAAAEVTVSKVTSSGGFFIGANSVLNATTLGSAIINSSLTSVGNLTAGSISSGFGNISIAGSISAGTVSGNSITAANSLSIAGTSITGTTLGSAIVNSSLTSVGNLTAGSISSGFGNITTTNNITGGKFLIGSTTVIEKISTSISGEFDIISSTNGTITTLSGNSANFGTISTDTINSSGDINVEANISMPWYSINLTSVKFLDKVFMKYQNGDDGSISITTSETPQSGYRNICIGAETNTNYGYYNIFMGTGSLFSHESGNDNIVIGKSAALNLLSGSGNVVLGSDSFFNAENSDNCVMLGYQAGKNINAGNNNIIIGNAVGPVATISGLCLYGTNAGAGLSLSNNDVVMASTNQLIWASAGTNKHWSPADGNVDLGLSTRKWRNLHAGSVYASKLVYDNVADGFLYSSADGTISASNTWNGGVISSAFGGTGVNNSGKTLTLGGNLTLSGSFDTTFTATANANLTLPAAGTLVSTVSTQTLTNKTISIAAGNLTLYDASNNTKQAVFSCSAISANGTRYFSFPDTNGTFMLLAAIQTMTNKIINNTNSINCLDSGFTLQNSANNTRQTVFDLSGLTAGQTRTLTVPDSSGTLILSSNIAAQTILTSQLSGTLASAQFPGITGHVAISAGSLTSSIQNNTVTNDMFVGSITASKLVGTDITTVGTISTGTWNGSVISGAFGGTGVNNSGRTLTLENNIYFSAVPGTSGNTVTLTTSGQTNLTLPTSGTLATLGGTENFTNKTLASSTIEVSNTINARDDGFSIAGTNGKKFIFSTTSISPNSTRTLTVPDLSGTFILSSNIAAQTILTSQLSGTLASAQFPGLTGVVTASAGSYVTSIANGNVTLAMLQNISAGTILGNISGSSAGVSQINSTQLKSFLGLTSTDITESSPNLYFSNDRVLTAMSGLYEVPLTFSTGLLRSSNTISINSTQNISRLTNLTAGYVRADASGNLSVDNSSFLTSAPTITLSGAVSGSGSGSISTSFANISANSFFGNASGTSATPSAISVTQAKTLLAYAQNDISGLEPSANPVFAGITAGAGTSLQIRALNVSTPVNFITLTSGSSPSCDLSGSVTIAGKNIADLDSTQNFSNKTLSGCTATFNAPNITIRDDTDTTKQARFNLSGLTTGTVSTYNLPSTAGTIVTQNHSQSLSNKTINSTNTITIRDSNFTIQSSSDSSKVFQFSAASISTGQTRTLTVPDLSGTLILSSNISSQTILTSQLSGTLASAQFPGITGHVAISAGSLTSSIQNGVVTDAMLAGSITASKLVGTDIGTVGTISAGTWNGSVISGAFGGTGVNNSGKTLTLGGNLSTAAGLTFAGNFAGTLRFSALTDVTLPTSGTLATLAGTETLTNKTIQIADANLVLQNGTRQAVFSLIGLTLGQTRTLTVPDSSGTLILTSNISSQTILTSQLSGTLASAQFPEITGHVAISAGSLTSSIQNGVVTDAMLAGSITASKLVGTDITTVGTISSGIWNAGIISGAFGGTGVNNSGRTITLGGNLSTAAGLTFAGNFAGTLRFSALTDVTLPTSGTLSTLAGTESLTNKTLNSSNTVTLLDTLFTLQDDTDTTKQARFNLSGLTTGTVSTYSLPSTAGTLVTQTHAQSLSNKTLNSTNVITVLDSNFTIQDDADNTKQVQFIASTVGTGTTRSLTVPNSSGTLTLLAATQSLTNKTLDNTNSISISDSNFFIQAAGASGKQVQFSASLVTVGQIRTITVPDSSGTLIHSGTLSGYSIAASQLTGTISASRMPALTGDVTSTSGTVSTTIAAGAVTLAKMANIATGTILGNNSGSSAAPSALSLTTVGNMLGTSDCFRINLGASMAGGTYLATITIPYTMTFTVANFAIEAHVGIVESNVNNAEGTAQYYTQTGLLCKEYKNTGTGVFTQTYQRSDAYSSLDFYARVTTTNIIVEIQPLVLFSNNPRYISVTLYLRVANYSGTAMTLGTSTIAISSTNKTGTIALEDSNIRINNVQAGNLILSGSTLTCGTGPLYLEAQNGGNINFNTQVESIYLRSFVRMQTLGISGNYSMGGADESYLMITAPVGGLTITLPQYSTAHQGKIFTFKDIGGNASSRNITISRFNTSDSIQGSATVVLNTNYGIIRLILHGNIWYLV